MIQPELLSEIHAQFRRQMNADVSASLRVHGVSYKLAFGVPSMRLKDVAALYEPSDELAETLWQEDIRESKMLATRLYPIGTFTRPTAERWTEEAPYDEISDQLVMNLLARVPYVQDLLDTLTKSDDRRRLYTALKLATRLGAPSLREKAARILNDTRCDIALRTAASLYLS